MAKGSFLSKFGIGRREWQRENVAPAEDINPSTTISFGAGSTTVASLLGAGDRAARSRNLIYEKWSIMEGAPIVSSAIKLLVTSALGGHDTSGDVVFIEKTPAVQNDARLAKVVDEISAEVAPILNRAAFTIAYIGCVFGDAYARVYSDAYGVRSLDVDELLRPVLVQPYERAGKTVGYAIAIGERNFMRMDKSQIARLKMPRTQWVPQYGVIEKSLKQKLEVDDWETHPIMPSLVGGSLLYNAESSYDNLTASLLGLVGQRWQDSIDEQIITANMDSMTHEDQSRFLASVRQMMMASKAYAEQAVKANRPVMERIRHILPVFGDKQMLTVMPANGGQPGRAGNVSIEDVMLHARLLSGAFGVDLSMIGFADQMSGGLGEGGFFRTSAQAAENARFIRTALTDFFNDIIDIHTLKRYGMVFNEADRPWQINFYSAISALESEAQRTKLDSMNSGAMLAQVMQQMKDMGADEAMMREFLIKIMKLDDEEATMFAKIVNAKKPEGEEGGGGF